MDAPLTLMIICAFQCCSAAEHPFFFFFFKYFFGLFWLRVRVRKRRGVTRSKGTRAGSRTQVRCRASAHGSRTLPTELCGAPAAEHPLP